jgi:hypothetical protein
MREIFRKLEENFDPTGPNAASDVAEAALKLATKAAYALESDKLGMRMGRDTAGEMGVAILELLRACRLLPYHYTGADADAFYNMLLDRTL